MAFSLDLTTETRLLRGRNIEFDKIVIKNMTLGEIDDIGMLEYLTVINFSTLSKEKVVGRELIAVFEEYSFFQIVVNYPQLRDSFIELLKMFTLNDGKEHSVRYVPELDIFVVSYNGVNGKITEENFEDFLECIRTVYNIPKVEKESERLDIDDEMADLLKEFEEAEAKVNSEIGNGITITSIIEGVSAKHPSINLINIWDYTMYKLMRTYYRLEQIESATNIMTGIYSGCVETKKIDLKEYHWAKKLD